MLAHSCYLSDPRIRREAEALAEKGIEVHVISSAEKPQGIPEPRNSIVKGVQVHRLPIRKKRGGFFRYVYEYSMTGILGAIKLAILQFQGRINVVHVHNMPDILVVAAIVPRLLGCKLVLDVHDPSPEQYMSWNHAAYHPIVAILHLQEKISCWLADRVISVNETMRENLQAKGVPDEKIAIVHNFPDGKYFPVCSILPPWPRDPKRLTLLYCGTVTHHYDLGLAIKALARLKGDIPITLKIMGDGKKLVQVLELASKLGVRSSVELVARTPIDKVADEMRKADIGISCHRAGVFGDLYFSTKIVEYLTQGLCVISAGTYTIKKYLGDDCLFYFQPGNDAELAESIRYAWQNPSEVVARMTNASHHLPRFSWQVEKNQFLQFYAGLLNEDPTAATMQETR
jgi:glycosyltransferase involved in cell wall biosynthesis